MSTFNTKPLEVLGGQQWLKWAPLEAFSAIAYGPTYAITSVTLNGGYSWADVYYTFETCVFTEESNSGGAGSSWHQEINLFIPGDDAAMRTNFENMVNQRWVLAANDFKDKLTVLGSRENGCRVKVKFNSQSKVSGLMGTLITFYRDDFRHTRQIAKSVLF